MTLQEIIKSSPTDQYSSIYLYIGDNCVWDYKEGIESILLISQEPCIESEKVSLQELINYAKELDYPEDILTLECEYERTEFKEGIWSTNKVSFSF